MKSKTDQLIEEVDQYFSKVVEEQELTDLEYYEVVKQLSAIFASDLIVAKTALTT